MNKYKLYLGFAILADSLFFHLVNKQCWKFMQVCQSEADNFGGGPEIFC